MNTLIMTIGVSGSGKSTWAKEHKEIVLNYDDVDDVFIVSSDAIRAELFGDESDQTHNKEVFDELHKRIIDIFKNNDNVDVIYDATNLSRKRRINFLNMLDSNIRRVAKVFPSTYEDAVKRVNMRERKVPEEVIRRQFKQMEFPQWFEGWNEIDFRFNDVVNKDKVLCDMIIDHDNHHHAKNILNHSFSVAKHFIDHFDWVFGAALYHDCGKPFAKQFKNTKGESTKEAHYYGHEHYGAQLSLMFCDTTKSKLIARAQLIDLHMEHYRLSDNKLEELYYLMDYCKVPNYIENLGLRPGSRMLKSLNNADKAEA